MSTLKVLGSRLPNCVIIDEIDGATGGAEGHSAISALLKIINAGGKPQGKGGCAARVLAKPACLLPLVGPASRKEESTTSIPPSSNHPPALLPGPAGSRGDKAAGEGGEAGGDKGAGGGRGSKKGKGPPPLARPLICIANDLYAPALRPLREVAQIFQFKVRVRARAGACGCLWRHVRARRVPGGVLWV